MSSEEKCCPKDNEKYSRMGVTPEELCLRQEGKCHLELFIDNVDGEFQIDQLYCTDNEEFALTKDLLNPTFECIRCLNNKLINTVSELMEAYKVINKFTIDILQAFSAAEKNSDKEVYISMAGITLLDVRKFMDKTFIYTEYNSPIRNNGDVSYLFGKRIEIDNSIKAGIIMVNPANITVEI